MMANTAAIAVSLVRPIRCSGVAMFHVGRCGSTVVGDMLNQHPRIRWAGEVFEDYSKGRLPRAERMVPPMWALRGQMARCEKSIFGLEVKTHATQHLRVVKQTLQQHVAALTDLGYGHFVALRRENHLRQFVSHLVGVRRKKFNVRRNETVRLTTVRIDPNYIPMGNRHANATLVDRFREFDAMYAEIESLIPASNLLSISYEREIEQDPRVAYRLICDFVGVQEQPVEITQGRSNPFPLRDIIENWSDVEDALRGTEYAWMLSDEAGPSAR